MPKVTWKANRVISIETKRKDENRKENVYVLAQMINKAQLLVFNLFSTDNRWENIDLSKVKIVHVAASDTLTKYPKPQYVNGVRVYDGVVTVRVYTDTMEAFVVSSTIDSTITIDTQNKISKEKAVRILKDQDKFKDIEIASAELVIYGNRLSWNFEITHSDISFIIMDANTGDILNVAYIEAIAKN